MTKAIVWCQCNFPQLHKFFEMFGLLGGHGPLDGHGHFGHF